VEQLTQLGIVAEVGRAIGVAAWLDEPEPGRRPAVSVGTATGALGLNGRGFSHRQLYLVAQCYADQPVEHLLGPGQSAADLNDDGLGRALDWRSAHAVTRRLAGRARRARRACGMPRTQRPADTPCFSVHGQ
jgi:hypothetical protein